MTEESEKAVDAGEAAEAAVQSEEKEQADEKAKAAGEEPEKVSHGDRRDDREMHKTTCAECGKEAEVPFKPSGDKPVYCQECFRKRQPKRSFGRDRGGFNRDRGPREMHKTTCAECGKEAEVPFKPNGEKPVLCKECFMKSKGA